MRTAQGLPYAAASIAGTHGSDERVLFGLLFGTGSLPWLGFALLGHWSDRELGLAVLVLLLSARELVASWTRARARPPVSSRTVWRNRWISHIWH